MKHPNVVCAWAIAAGSLLTGQSADDREKQLLDRIQQLEQRLAVLEAKVGSGSPASSAPAPAAVNAAASAPAQDQKSPTGDGVSLPGFASGTTLNFLLDGYYEY